MSDNLEKLVENFFAKKENLFGIEQITQFITEQYLLEKKGVVGYKPNERFVLKDDPSKEFFIKEVLLLPSDESLMFKNKEEAKKAVEDKVKKDKIELHAINSPAPSAILVVMADKNNKLHGYVRYFRKLKLQGHDTWLTPAFEKDTGIIRAESEEGITQSQAEKIPVKPSDLVADESLRNVLELQQRCISRAEQLKINETIKKHITDIFTSINEKTKCPTLVGGARYAKVYNKYLAEVLAPMSLLTGWICEGDREKSQVLLDVKKQKKYSPDMKISFNEGLTEPIADSYVHHDLGKIYISSKGGSGAPASLREIFNIVDTMTEDEKKKFNGEYPVVSMILSTVGTKSSATQPIELASFIGLINKQEKKILEEMLNDISMSIVDFNKKYGHLLNKNNSINNAWKAITPKSERFYPIVRVISGLAKLCSVEINSNKKYKFHDGMKQILSFGMIQMNSYMKIDGENCQFTKFIVKYPPEFQENIILDSSKNYTASSVTGGFCFKIP